MQERFLIALPVAFAVGCTTADVPANGSLEGTEWDLSAFISMDDAIGRIEPGPDQSLSIEFGADGRAAMQLDCNRGTASYSTTETRPTGGELSFGPIAATRAMCPNPRLSDLMAAQLPNVVSYSLRDGNLSLALKMDGGIFEFEPAN